MGETFKTLIRGYVPCRIVSKNISARGQVLVEFEGIAVRRWFPANRVKGADRMTKARP